MNSWIFLALAAIVLIGSNAAAGGEAMKNLEVKLGFADVPVNHTCEGRDTSPEIEVHMLNATSVAVIVEDIDAPRGTFTHWIAWNIEPREIVPEAIPRNATVQKPIRALQGVNSFGKIGYWGPCPPPGKAHRYYFRVYGLDRMLNLSAGATRQELERAMQGHVLQEGEAMASFGGSD
jgi:Raf kinase inhibitor-like YbhB/YbcL family protein